MTEPTRIPAPAPAPDDVLTTSPAGFVPRPMTADDCAEVAEIRIRGWQYAYKGFVPQPYLDGLDIAADADRQRARLLAGDRRVVNLVVDGDGGKLLGWVALGPYRDGGTHTEDAELYALYLRPRHIGRGVGRALLASAVRHCAAAGHPRMYLWVLKDNTRARRFYERAGFAADGAEEAFEVGGAVVPEVRYVKDLRG
ncbi:GNAT family N-acetyltransferase [Streptomyces hirsutus]